MKILINSYPRSGTTTLVDAIRAATTSGNLMFGEDFFHNEDWISKSHLPVLFLGTFPSDVLIGTVIRDPLDAISSNCFRWVNGYTGNIVQGKVVIDKSRESKENKFDKEVMSLIDHQVNQYISYYSCLLSNIDKVLLFRYDKIQNDIDSAINRVVYAAGGSKESLNYTAAQKVIKNPPQPTKEKTVLYFKIREHIKSLTALNDAYRLYDEALRMEKDKNE